MKEKLTHIVFIVDRSGSMRGIANDMIGGFNSFIAKQKEIEGECVVSFYQFDSEYETVFDKIPLHKVKDLTNKTYSPRGSTALYDAMGKTIDDYGVYLSSLQESDRPERVLVVTITDGENNSSKEFNLTDIKNRIKVQTETYDWDFVFIGSNIDSWEVGDSIGISRGATLQFSNCADSVGNVFASLSDNATNYRISAHKMAYSFTKDDLNKQDKFLNDNQKSKNVK